MPVNIGERSQPARIISDGNEASFSQSGKSIYYTSGGQLWKADVDGGSAKQLTHGSDVSLPVEAADGKYVIFHDRRGIFRVPADGGRVEVELGGTRVKLHVPDQVRVEVEVEIDGDAIELELELKWSTAPTSADHTAEGPVKTKAARRKPNSG